MIIVGLLYSEEEANELRQMLKIILVGQRSRYLASNKDDPDDYIDKLIKEVKNEDKQRKNK